MGTETFRHYVRDLGLLIKRKAIEAASKRDSATASDRAFLEGLALGYINVVSLMLQQATAFAIDPADLNLDGFEPDSLH
jgi:hypothetical protein